MGEIRTDAGQRIDKALGQVSDALVDLWERWQDESEHEDLVEYGRVLDSLLPEDVTVERATRRPFGVIVRHAGRRFQMFANRRSVGWKALR